MEGSSESSWVWEGPKRQVSLNPGPWGLSAFLKACLVITKATGVTSPGT